MLLIIGFLLPDLLRLFWRFATFRYLALLFVVVDFLDSKVLSCLRYKSFPEIEQIQVSLMFYLLLLDSWSRSLLKINWLWFFWNSLFLNFIWFLLQWNWFLNLFNCVFMVWHRTIKMAAFLVSSSLCIVLWGA